MLKAVSFIVVRCFRHLVQHGKSGLQIMGCDSLVGRDLMSVGHKKLGVAIFETADRTLAIFPL